MIRLLSKYLVPGMGGLIVALMATVGVQGCKNGTLRDTLAETRSTLQSALDALDTNQVTIASLKQANEQCFDQIETSEKAQAAAVQQLKAQREQLLEQSRNRKERVRIIREDPDCDDLLNMDINQICPSLAKAVRQK